LSLTRGHASAQQQPAVKNDAQPVTSLVSIAAVVILAVSLLAQPATDTSVPPLRVERQGSFFVGGHDIHSDTLSSTATRAPSGTVTVDQVYVRYQIPVGATGRPLTLIHGCCLTGKTWETTPDGRMGWDEYFVRKGRGVYVIDQASRGRSAANPSAINDVRRGHAEHDRLPSISFLSHEEAWAVFRFGPEYPKVFSGQRFPLEAEAEFWKQMVPDWVEALPTPNPTLPALSELAQRVNGTVLVSHSQSGIYPFQTAAVKVGVRAELVLLPDVGFHGNSHMLMQDKNSLAIADWLLAWIDRRVEQHQ
jgi:hypothetical protein